MSVALSDNGTDSSSEVDFPGLPMLDMIRQITDHAVVEQTPQAEIIRQDLEHSMECLALAHFIACRENCPDSLRVAEVIDLFVDGHLEFEGWADTKAQVPQLHPMVSGQSAMRFFLAMVLNCYFRMSQGLQTTTVIIVYSWQDCVRLLIDSTMQHMRDYHSAMTRFVQSMISGVLQDLNGAEIQQIPRFSLVAIQIPASTAPMFTVLDASAGYRRFFVQSMCAAIAILRTHQHGHIARMLSNVAHLPVVASTPELRQESNMMRQYLADHRLIGSLHPYIVEDLEWWKNALRDNDPYAAWRPVVCSLLTKAMHLLTSIDQPRAEYTVLELKTLLSEPLMAPSHGLYDADSETGAATERTRQEAGPSTT